MWMYMHHKKVLITWLSDWLFKWLTDHNYCDWLIKTDWLFSWMTDGLHCLSTCLTTRPTDWSTNCPNESMLFLSSSQFEVLFVRWWGCDVQQYIQVVAVHRHSGKTMLFANHWHPWIGETTDEIMVLLRLAEVVRLLMEYNIKLYMQCK